MALININFNKLTENMKPVHGVGQPPFFDLDFSMLRYLKEANIPYSRLHDVGGFLGGGRFVDIPNIFRDFNNDPSDPESYDFSFTDILIKSLVNSGVKPFFRLGVTIENDAKIKAYRIYPPLDFKKWAKICEGIIKHYNYGWSNGYYFSIEYWEIWNEPDNDLEDGNNQMWLSSKEKFYELYKVASVYLKNKFPELKFGGYGSCGFYAITDSYENAAKSSKRTDYFIEFFIEFLKYAKKNNCPLDFFSWHSYASVNDTEQFANYSRKMLDKFGFTKTQSICDEWNCEPFERGTAHHCAVTTSMIIKFQNSSVSSAMFYDARVGVSTYSALFNPLTLAPFPAYYAFFYYGELFTLKKQCFSQCDSDDLSVLSSSDGKTGKIIITNPTEQEIPIALQCSDFSLSKCYITDEKNINSECSLCNEILPNATLYIEMEKA